jgi:hypothetical protein
VFLSWLTSAARCAGTGVARASYWSLRSRPITIRAARLNSGLRLMIGLDDRISTIPAGRYSPASGLHRSPQTPIRRRPCDSATPASAWLSITGDVAPRGRLGSVTRYSHLRAITSSPALMSAAPDPPSSTHSHSCAGPSLWKIPCCLSVGLRRLRSGSLSFRTLVGLPRCRRGFARPA